MANLPLAFAELLGGGVLLTAGLSGSSIPDVFAGAVSLKSFDAGGAGGAPTGGDTAAPASTTSGAPLAAASPHGAVNPFARARGVHIGRVDMGVDVSMEPGSPIVAPFTSRLVRISPNWYAGQPGMYFQVTDGPNKGRWWYLAEQINPSVRVGQTVRAGEQVATYAQHGTAVEMGWAGNERQTLAQTTTGYTEGQVTVAGQSFRNFLHSVGV